MNSDQRRILFEWVMELVDEYYVKPVDAYAAMRLMLSMPTVEQRYLRLYMCACIRVVTAYRCCDDFNNNLMRSLCDKKYSRAQFNEAIIDILCMTDTMRDDDDQFEMMCRDKDISDVLHDHQNRDMLVECVRMWTRTSVLRIPDLVVRHKYTVHVSRESIIRKFTHSQLRHESHVEYMLRLAKLKLDFNESVIDWPSFNASLH